MINVVAEQEITLGREIVIEGVSLNGPYAVFFEDDGFTGYFYALDNNKEMRIINAMHVYNVENVVDKHLPSKVVIGWSLDDLNAVLLINDYPHAIFDFQSKHGYCRTGFPPPSEQSGWGGHEWDENAIHLFKTE